MLVSLNGLSWLQNPIDMKTYRENPHQKIFVFTSKRGVTVDMLGFLALANPHVEVKFYTGLKDADSIQKARQNAAIAGAEFYEDVDFASIKNNELFQPVSKNFFILWKHLRPLLALHMDLEIEKWATVCALAFEHFGVLEFGDKTELSGFVRYSSPKTACELYVELCEELIDSFEQKDVVETRFGDVKIRQFNGQYKDKSLWVQPFDDDMSKGDKANCSIAFKRLLLETFYSSIIR